MQILLVDDNEISLELQKQLIENCGCGVTTANCGEQAIELSKKNDFSIILMDICMPTMDGFTAAEKIREFNRSVKIFALSADEIEKDNEAFVKSGMNGALKKPLSAQDISLLFDGEMISKADNNENSVNGEIFGYSELLSLVGDENSVVLVLQSFLDSHKNDWNLLREYISAGDFLSARGVMHTLTGVAGSLFCHRLFEASSALSADLRKERSDSFESFTEIWNMTVAELTACCDNLNK